MNSQISDALLKKCLQSEVTDDDRRRLKIESYQLDSVNSKETVNISGNMLNLRISFTIDSVPRTRRFVVKAPIPKENPILQKLLNEFNIPVELRYAKEKYFYQYLAPKINAFEFGPIVPAYYHLFDDYRLVLDDLREFGYRDTTEQMTGIDEVTSTLQILAKLHAISHKLRADEPDSFPDRVLEEAFFDKSDVHLATDAMRPVFETILNIEYVPLSCRRKFLSVLDSFRENSTNLMSHDNFSFNVLNHGDLKKDNILVKYDDTGKAVDSIMVDFQTYRWCSPAADVIWFLITAVSFELVEKNFDKFVDFYLETFNRYLTIFDCSTKYTRERFDEDEKKLFELKVYAFTWFSYWYSFWTIGGDMPLDYDDKKTFARQICQNSALKKTFFNWLDHFRAKNLL